MYGAKFLTIKKRVFHAENAGAADMRSRYLCFALASRRAALVGVRHPCDITVTTGKTYAHRHTSGIQSATCKGNSPMPRCCLAPSDNSLLPGGSATTSCSNVIMSIISHIVKSVKGLFHFFFPLVLLARQKARSAEKSSTDLRYLIASYCLMHGASFICHLSKGTPHTLTPPAAPAPSAHAAVP